MALTIVIPLDGDPSPVAPWISDADEARACDWPGLVAELVDELLERAEAA